MNSQKIDYIVQDPIFLCLFSISPIPTLVNAQVHEILEITFSACFCILLPSKLGVSMFLVLVTYTYGYHMVSIIKPCVLLLCFTVKSVLSVDLFSCVDVLVS